MGKSSGIHSKLFYCSSMYKLNLLLTFFQQLTKFVEWVMGFIVNHLLTKNVNILKFKLDFIN